MKYRLFEYDTGHEYGAASEEAVEKFKAALAMGRPFFLYPYFGYFLKMTVRTVVEKERSAELQSSKEKGQEGFPSQPTK